MKNNHDVLKQPSDLSFVRIKAKFDEERKRNDIYFRRLIMSCCGFGIVAVVFVVVVTRV